MTQNVNYKSCDIRVEILYEVKTQSIIYDGLK